mmetsp:Transcript_18985/g.52737  ORF Transcript_18985/g.52737 Transcript_18985/m.52737 type:complete len:201 (+) Transcript_18985:901-1503(+)
MRLHQVLLSRSISRPRRHQPMPDLPLRLDTRRMDWDSDLALDWCIHASRLSVPARERGVRAIPETWPTAPHRPMQRTGPALHGTAELRLAMFLIPAIRRTASWSQDAYRRHHGMSPWRAGWAGSFSPAAGSGAHQSTIPEPRSSCPSFRSGWYRMPPQRAAAARAVRRHSRQRRDVRGPFGTGSDQDPIPIRIHRKTDRK